MLIHDLFPAYDGLACNTGNLFITGLEKMGADGCFLQLIYNVLTENTPVFYFDNRLSKGTELLIKTKAESQGYTIININNKMCEGTSFDLLSAFHTVDEKVDILCSLLSRPDDKGLFALQMCRYLRDAVLATDERGRGASIRELLSLTVEEVQERLAASSRLSRSEFLEERSFLEATETYSLWGTINDRVHSLKACGLLDILSGSRRFETVFGGKVLLLVSQRDDTFRTGQVYSSLVNVFASALVKFCSDRNDDTKPYHIFIHDSTELGRELFAALLGLAQESMFGLPLCVYDTSVNKTIDRHSEYVLDQFGAFAVFKTNDGAYWSNFLGTALVPDRAETYTRRKTPVMVSTGGGVVGRRTARYEGTTVHRVEKPLYEARVFSGLNEKEVIFYNVYTNRKTRKKLEW